MRTLVIAPSWVGDMVMAEPLTALVGHGGQNEQVFVAAPARTRALATRMPHVREVLDFPFDHGQFALTERMRVGRGWCEYGFDRAIVLPNSWKSAVSVRAAGIPTRVGYVGEARYGLLNDLRRLDARALPKLVQRYLALGLPRDAGPPSARAPRLRANPERATALRAQLVAEEHAPVLALCPGAEYGPAKRWPPARFAELARLYVMRGYRVWLFGAAQDVPIAAAIRASLDAVENSRIDDLVGKTSLLDAVDLLSLVDVVASNDSGLMHVAAALGRPVVGIFGSSSPDYTPPLGPATDVVGLDLACRPCFARTCRFGHTACLRDIDAVRVAHALERVVAHGSAP